MTVIQEGRLRFFSRRMASYQVFEVSETDVFFNQIKRSINQKFGKL